MKLDGRIRRLEQTTAAPGVKDLYRELAGLPPEELLRRYREAWAAEPETGEREEELSKLSASELLARYEAELRASAGPVRTLPN